MSKYFQILKDNRIFDFETNNIEIENVIVDQKEKTYTPFFVIEKSLTYQQYILFTQGNNNYFKSSDIKFKPQICYKSNNLTNENYLEYLNMILKELSLVNPLIQAFLDLESFFEDNQLVIKVDEQSTSLSVYLDDIVEQFKNYGLEINAKLEISEHVRSVEEIQNEIVAKANETLVKKQVVAQEIAQKSQISIKSRRSRIVVNEKSRISAIPNTQDGIALYSHNVGEPNFQIEAEVFGIEIRTFKSGSTMASIKVTDFTDSIVVKKWLRGENEIKNFNEFANGDVLLITAKAEYDSYARSVVLTADSISYVGKHQEETVIDDAPIKRVELHAHTKMSNLDGVSEAADYIAQALKWGHKAIAFTDHNGVYAIPDINKACKKVDIKPIYGVELPFIDESKDYDIAFTNESIDLRTASYVVFDFETTGFSQEYDRLIEIAAVKVYQGGIIDKFESFVNPERPIGQKSIDITGITEEMLIGAPKTADILPEFINFCQGSILVAHNARFDMGMFYANMDRIGISGAKFPVIDTLNLLRAVYYKDLKRFNLKAMSKYFKVKQLQHHRAIDDTKVTAECFLYMLQDMFKNKIDDYNMINTLINQGEIFKQLIPAHINLIVQNQIGYKNLFKIVSDALTVHCTGEACLLKSVLQTHREGLLVGSGCVNGLVFEKALNGNLKELKEAIDYCDYIEVQPPAAYRHLFGEMIDGEERIKKTIIKIIKVAKEMNKMVVATSDCHYLRPNLKNYRDILIASPQIGGGTHALGRYNESPCMHFRTTTEMISEFKFLGDKDLIMEIVVENTNLIADSIEKIQCFHKEMFVPADDEFKDNLGIPSMIEEMKKIVDQNVVKFYGASPHPIVSKRINRELSSIIDSGYYSTYYMAHLLVVRSLNDGYLVGSRGSIGSSLVATMMDITEINPLAPHYRCPKCKFSVFKMNEEEKDEYIQTENERIFQTDLSLVESGYDLPNAICPVCGEKLIKDGHDIPFETFLGFNGDKVPDIDLNFSGEYQSEAHEFVRYLMGNDYSYRGGTVATIADKNGYGYVKAYCEKKHIELRSVEIERMAETLVGIKRSTGQHPGGIVVVPKRMDIYDVTPFQYPANNIDSSWRTTHFDYHSFEDNLLKLDILGHDDPTLIKYMMGYVNEHQADYSFTSAQDIPIDDNNVYRLFCGTEVIGVSPGQIDSTVASYAVPEFGTTFVRQMLQDTLPKTFAELVKISGLSHGTDVWLTNAQDLVLGKTNFGKIDFADVIGCRDDIMVYLLYQGLEPLKAFEIMEFVRKGRVGKEPDKWETYKSYMEEKNVPAWYIWSCERIKYMFPKAHATAYVLMALRIAWFKVYSPALFYSAYFSKRAKAHHVRAFVGGEIAIKEEINRTMNNPDQTAKDEDVMTSLAVALEMVSRGLKFLPVNIEKSDSLCYKVEDGSLRIPFVAVDGLGESAAIDIVEKRNEQAFTSKKDVMNRTKLNKSLFDEFEKMKAFGSLEDEDVEESKGIFAFLED